MNTPRSATAPSPPHTRARIGYTATAGTLTIRDDEAQADRVSIFYTAYTPTARNRAHRPVTFFYNGGPGSSTVWLRMGSSARCA